jgi:phage-related protein
VQHGLEPNDWKSLTTVGVGVREIRIHTGVEHRVVYVATFAEAVYVLHVFEKTTRKTATSDINLAKQRFRELINLRRTLEHGAKE